MEKWIYDDTNLGFKPGGVLHKEHCPTLRAERSGLKVIEVTKCILYGMLTNGVYAKMHDCSRRVYDPNGVSPTIHTVGGGNLEPKVVVIGNTNPSGNGMNGNVYDSEELAPTLTTNKGEGNKVMVKQATSQGYTECEIVGVADLSYPESKTRRGRVQEGGKICPTITAESNGLCHIEHRIVRMTGRNPENPKSRKGGLPTEQMMEPRLDNNCGTLTTVQKDNLLAEMLITSKEEPSGIYTDAGVYDGFRVRKLTPKECWRLMGFTDDDFDKAKQGLNETHYKGRDRSNSQLYKQAGNSIVKQVLMAIFGEMKGGAE